MLDVMFYEVFKEEEAAIKRFLPEGVNARFTPKTAQEQNESNAPAALISIRTQSRIPEQWAGALKGILTRSAGFDHLVEYLKRTGAGIPCGYLPDYCSRAVAEQAILMMMALFRKLRAQIRNFDRFDRDNITGQECQGKNLLVIGVGRIGSLVVEIGQGLRMNVKGVDIKPGMKGLEYIALEEGMRWAHAVVCALPLTQQTKGLLNGQVFRKGRQGIVFINIARGEISPLGDLKTLLDEGVMAALGLDVFEEEAGLAEFLRRGEGQKDRIAQITGALKEKENVLFTPHNAFNTREAVERKAQQSIKAVMAFLEKQSFPDLIPGE